MKLALDQEAMHWEVEYTRVDFIVKSKKGLRPFLSVDEPGNA